MLLFILNAFLKRFVLRSSSLLPSLSLSASLSLSRSQSLFPCARARVRAFTYVCGGFLQLKNDKKRARDDTKKLVKSNKSNKKKKHIRME